MNFPRSISRIPIEAVVCIGGAHGGAGAAAGVGGGGGCS